MAHPESKRPTNEADPGSSAPAEASGFRADVAAVLAGALFSVGLAVSGMTQPGKVVGFLDVTGDWDPSLAFVMGGAVLVYAVAMRATRRMAAPLLAERFQLPTRHDLPPQLFVGAALFGMGWAISGFCPGPALTALGAGMHNAWVFVPAVLVGMALFRGFAVWSAGRRAARG